MESSSGAFRFGSCLIILRILPGDVKYLFRMCSWWINWILAFTSGKSGPGFVVNWRWKLSVNSLAFSAAVKTGPFGSVRKWSTGDLLNKFLFNLKIELLLGSKKDINLSHLSCLWVRGKSLIKDVYWFNKRFIVGSCDLCQARCMLFLGVISEIISKGRSKEFSSV